MTSLTNHGARCSCQAILTLAIPTYNRAPFLALLLESILPQAINLQPGDFELLISDNCSTDDTPAIVAGLQARGLTCRSIRNETNIGADGNFLQCLDLASGQYVWLMGDDDLLAENAIPALLSLLRQREFDLVYLSSYAFSANGRQGELHDRLGRFAEHVTDGGYFLDKVNALIGLISVNIVNKNKLEATSYPPIEELNHSNLMQVGWLFPLIHQRMSVLYVWDRLVGYRSYNSGGWGVCEVFGVRMSHIAERYFASERVLARRLMNSTLRYWLCDAIFGMRRGLHAEMNQEDFAADIRHIFHSNWRYWIFIYPMAEFPLPVVRPLHAVLTMINKVTRMVSGMVHHLGSRSRYLRP